MKPTAKILVIDDEANIRFFLEETLSKDGYQVTTADSGEMALQVCSQEEFELALIDLQMPGMSGIELLTRLHQCSPDTIVIILTAYGTLESAVEALRYGAHDYLFKPCKSGGIRESVQKGLLKRQQKVMQRAILTRLEQELMEDLKDIQAAVHPQFNPAPQIPSEPESKEIARLEWKDLMIDLTRHVITINNLYLDLTPTEFGMLVCLVNEAPGIVSAQQLIHEVHGYESQTWEAGEIVRYHIYRIRQKLKKLSGRDDFIRTVRSVGYALYE